MKKNTKKGLIAPLVLCLILVGIDQITKLAAFTYLRLIGQAKFIPGFISLVYVENRGAAFGMFSDYTFLLGIFSLLIIATAIAAMLKGMISDRRIIWVAFLIIAGGIGNVIDRLFRGFVVDFFQFDFSLLRNFPVFNVADCYVSIGAVLLCIFILISDYDEGDKKVEKDSEDSSSN